MPVEDRGNRRGLATAKAARHRDCQAARHITSEPPRDEDSEGRAKRTPRRRASQQPQGAVGRQKRQTRQACHSAHDASTGDPTSFQQSAPQRRESGNEVRELESGIGHRIRGSRSQAQVILRGAEDASGSNGDKGRQPKSPRQSPRRIPRELRTGFRTRLHIDSERDFTKTPNEIPQATPRRLRTGLREDSGQDSTKIPARLR